MKQKKVVILSALRVFPAISGGQLRTKFIAQGFAACGYAVTIVSLADKRVVAGESSMPPAPIREVVLSSPLFTFFTRVGYRLGCPPFWIDLKLRYCRRRLVREYLATADILVADFPFVARGFDYFKGLKILNTHNVEHPLFPRTAGIRRWVQALEVKAYQQADLTLCCTPTDAQFFQNLGSQTAVAIVPNGIDVVAYQQSAAGRVEIRQQLGFEDDALVLLFPASSYGPNKAGVDFLLAFAEHHLNRLSQLKIKIIIVGSVLPAKVYNDVVEAYGKVATILPFFAAADLAINPIFSGSGSSLKVAEFIAAGLPLLTTAIGSRGFDLDEQSACFFDNEETLLAAIETCVAQPDHWSVLSEMAWQKNQAFISGETAFKAMVEKLV